MTLKLSKLVESKQNLPFKVLVKLRLCFLLHLKNNLAVIENKGPKKSLLNIRKFRLMKAQHGNKLIMWLLS